MREGVLFGKRRTRRLGRRWGLKIQEFSGGQGAHEGFCVYVGVGGCLNLGRHHELLHPYNSVV